MTSGRVSEGMNTWAAIGSEDDRREVARRLARAREALVGGATPDSLGVRGVIERSWERCGGLADLKGDRPPQAYASEEAVERFAASPLAVARPVLSSMMSILGPMERHLIIVTDAKGTILWTDGPLPSLHAGDAIGAVPGGVWEEAISGTNGMGTALAERHPVQIFGAEHLRSGVERWVCSAAPVRDPETGEILGVVDLSGEFDSAHPHSLITVMTAARTIEHLLAEKTESAHAGLRDAWGSHIRRSGAVALVSARGTVIETSRPGWYGRRVAVADLERGATRIEADMLEVQPVPGGYVLRTSAVQGSRPRFRPAADALPVPELSLEALGLDRARVTVDGETVALSRRHSEILVLLAGQRTGMTDEQIALKLHGEAGRPVTARVELSRLRKLLGAHVVTSAPYRLRGTVRTDFFDVEESVRAGRLGEALDRYAGVLLPRSESPVVSEIRERIDYALRSAVMASPDLSLLCRWIEHPAGEDDIEACRVLATALDQQDPRRAGVLSRLRRLSQPSRGRSSAQ
jgi:hypothetical protein